MLGVQIATILLTCLCCHANAQQMVVAQNLTVVTLPGSGLFIYLFGSDFRNGTLHATIQSLPAHGELFQTDGVEILTKMTQDDLPVRVTDTFNRVFYGTLETGAFSDSFQFIMTSDDSNPLSSLPAQVMISALESSTSSPVDCHGARNVEVSNMGQVSLIQLTLTHEWSTVHFSHAFQHPVVIAQPLSYNGHDSAVVRIVEVTNSSFTLYVQEGTGTNPSHTLESVSFLVAEEGTWRLSDGTTVEVGRFVTAATVGNGMDQQQQKWAHPAFAKGFSSAPVVLAQVQSNNDPHWVSTRMQHIGNSSFELALEEEEINEEVHGSEIVGYIAALPSSTATWGPTLFESGITDNLVTDHFFTIQFHQSFTGPVNFLASIQSFHGTDSAHLRYSHLGQLSVQVKVEEDASWDHETTHTNEVVGYFVIQGNDSLSAIPDACFEIPQAKSKTIDIIEAVHASIQLVDPPSQYQSAEITGLPTKGELRIEDTTIVSVPASVPSGEVTYVALPGHQGESDSFTFRIVEGSIKSSPANVSITIQGSSTPSTDTTTTTSSASTHGGTHTTSATAATTTHSTASSSAHTGATGTTTTPESTSGSISFPLIKGTPNIGMAVVIAVITLIGIVAAVGITVFVWKRQKKQRQSIPMLLLHEDEDDEALLSNFE